MLVTGRRLAVYSLNAFAGMSKFAALRPHFI
jgi:hypothetical protein